MFDAYFVRESFRRLINTILLQNTRNESDGLMVVTQDYIDRHVACFSKGQMVHKLRALVVRTSYLSIPIFFLTVIPSFYQSCDGHLKAAASQNEPSTSSSSSTSSAPPAQVASYSWVGSAWNTCSVLCGGGQQTRTVSCELSSGAAADSSNCSLPKPVTNQVCNTQACASYMWVQGGFGPCSLSCGGGTQSQTVSCVSILGQTVANSFCSGTPPPASRTCNVQACPSGGSTVFFDDFSAGSLSSDWTVIQRRGPISQNEIACNTASAISVVNGLLHINTSATPAICGDAVTAPTQLPYSSGDIQWKSLSFTYGQVEVRAKFPPKATKTWPAIWLLGSNCQAANLVNGSEDSAFDGCPAQGNSAYQEIDMIECDQRSWCHLTMAQGSDGWTSLCEFPVDANWHVFTLTWNASKVSMAIDGASTGCSFPNTSLHGPMFLIIQTQVTSASGVAGAPDNSLLPADFQIDYVKVTQP